jgi:putative transcriptional regulator
MKKKRDIFGELTEGLAALKQQREGKVTLRTFKMESNPAPSISRGITVSGMRRGKATRAAKR